MEKKTAPNIGKKRTILIISIVVVTALIVACVGYFFYLVYHKDQPSFVPGETRGDIREGIKENIAEPLKDIWPSVGSAMIDSAYISPKRESTSQNGVDSTANWQTYKSEELGIEFKYPEGWIYIKGSEENTFSFAPNEDSYDGITIYSYTDKNMTVEGWWSDKNKEKISDYQYLGTYKYGNTDGYVYKEIAGMEQKYYLIHKGSNILMILPDGKGYDEVEDFIKNIN